MMTNSAYFKTLFWLGVGSWLVILFINGQVRGFDAAAELIKPSGIVLTILTLAIVAFEKWVWRWPGINSLVVKRPNLRGAYRGTIVSHWVNPETGDQLPPIPTFLSISQTFSDITVRLFTAESSSVSEIGSFIKGQDDCQELLYTYRNDPGIDVRKRSPIHYGAARLTVSEKNERLHGPYWTDRQTIGDMNFHRVSTSTCNSFQECERVAASVSA
jgi:hypothetical protein